LIEFSFYSPIRLHYVAHNPIMTMFTCTFIFIFNNITAMPRLLTSELSAVSLETTSADTDQERFGLCLFREQYSSSQCDIFRIPRTCDDRNWNEDLAVVLHSSAQLRQTQARPGVPIMRNHNVSPNNISFVKCGNIYTHLFHVWDSRDTTSLHTDR
jgi:hypothetical protein